MNLVIPFNLGLLVRLKFLDLILNQLLSKKNKQTKNTEKYDKRVDCIEKKYYTITEIFRKLKAAEHLKYLWRMAPQV